MELMFYDPKEAQALPEIKWNYEEIKNYALDKAAEYKSIAYTDADVAAMKKDRADINRFIAALDNERKNKKKQYMEPYTVFEQQVKDALQPLKEAESYIKKGLDEVEQQYRDAKTEKMQEYYEKHSGDLKELVPFKKTIREEYYKRAFTDKKLEQGYIDFFAHIREELSALDELPDRFRDKATLKYMESFSVSDALREGKRLEELEKLMQERKRKQEEEKARKLEEQVNKSQVPGQPLPVQQEIKAPVQNAEQAKEPVLYNPDEEVMSLDFRVWGTKEQLMGLRQYMINHNIKFGKVE